MNFVYDDGGREAAGFKGATGDCVVRAIAIAAQIPYREVYDALSEGCRSERRSKHNRKRSVSASAGVRTQMKWFKDYMASIGWSWTPTMGIGTGCKVHLVAEELPAGRLIVHTARHSVAVIDGVVHDLWDCSRPKWYLFPDKGQELKPGQWRESWRGEMWVHEKPNRCVYGYWMARQAIRHPNPFS